MSTVSIVMVNFNGYEHTRNALHSIAQSVPSCEVIVIDNHSDGNDVQRLREEFPHFIFDSLESNKGFGFANNVGARKASGDYLLFLNNDTLLTSDAPAMLGLFLNEHNDVAAIGPKLLNPDGTIQMSFGFDPSIGSEWRMKRLQRLSKENPSLFQRRLEPFLARPSTVDWLTGAALMVRRPVFDEAGGFDESFFMYFEDADICRRIRAKGWSVVYDPTCSITHIGGASVSSVRQTIRVEYRKSQLRYYAKHGSLVSQFLLRLYLLGVFGTRRIFSFMQSSHEGRAFTEIIQLALKPIR